MKNIPINKPSISELEIEYVNDAVSYGWGEKCYDYIYRFESQFKSYLNSDFALATSSCTGAIHLALMALGIKEGDEVIVPEITWIASIEPVLYIGAKPVFVDVLKDTWCINPESIKKAITPKTKAIIAVHLYGNLCEMNEIIQIAKENNIKIIEDAAEALGSEYYGKKAGSIADVGVFSFHGTKTMTTGEGGILVTNNETVYENAKILNDHGRNSKDPENKMFWMRNYGYKYKMSNIQAALGLAQIQRIKELVEKKRQIFKWYEELLINLNLKLNPEKNNTINSYWLPTIVISQSFEFNRDEFLEYMSKNNIDSRPFFYPLSSLPMFSPNKDNIVAYSIYKNGINLPSFHDISKDEVIYVVNIILNYFKRK